MTADMMTKPNTENAIATGRILLVDDDPIVVESLAAFLAQQGYETATATDGSEAMGLLDDAVDSDGQPYNLVITDVNMPRTDGVDLLRQIGRRHASTVVIMVTGYGTIESAVEAVKLGAFDYLTKPLIDEELLLCVGKALRQQALLAENVDLKNQLGTRGLGGMIGNDRQMQRVYDVIEAVAPTATTVLIHGQSGTGKSMLAGGIHEHSPRRDGPMVTFACGSIPETLLESELFGHVKGAFTGADSDKIGKLRAADGGTLFIDEINSATPALQLKLLRVLQEKQFEPVGSQETVKVDVRFVIATNQPLDKLVESGEFREDLYYRINVVNITLPNLSQRSGDIPALADCMLRKYCQATGKVKTGFADDTMAAMMRYRWPGNVRELENAVERAVVLAPRPQIELTDLPDAIAFQQTDGTPGYRERRRNPWLGGLLASEPRPLREAMEEPEKQIILAALKHHGWNRQKTAEDLDINRTTLYKKIKQYGLEELAAE